jgi:hypothetical protein
LVTAAAIGCFTSWAIEVVNCPIVATRLTCASSALAWFNTCAACLRSVMSLAIFEAPMIRPSAFLTGDTVSEMSARVPSLRRRKVS